MPSSSCVADIIQSSKIEILIIEFIVSLVSKCSEVLNLLRIAERDAQCGGGKDLLVTMGHNYVTLVRS